jgi:hypothetical protein
MAGVVIGDASPEWLHVTEPSVVQQLDQQARVVQHRPVAAQVRILVSQRVERVRISGDDSLELTLGERLDVLGGQRLE